MYASTANVEERLSWSVVRIFLNIRIATRVTPSISMLCTSPLVTV